MDEGLRPRILRGDPEAFGSLFDAFAEAVCNHAFRLVGNRAAAEDVMAATFLQAWRTHTRIDAEGGSLGPWLLGIATNVARNHNRSARRRRMLVARLATYAPEPSADIAEDVAWRLGGDARAAATRDALARLRLPERQVLALCVWSGLSYEQAAEALGIPVGTVRSRLSRARTKMQRYLAETLREPVGDAGQVTDGRAEAAENRQEATR